MDGDGPSTVMEDAEIIRKKFEDYKASLFCDIDSLVGQIETLKQDSVSSADGEDGLFESPTGELGSVLTLLKKKAVQGGELSVNHRSLHGSVSKVGRSIDKNFISDYSTVAHDFSSKDNKLLNEVISEHCLRRGCLGIAESLIEEAVLDLDEDMKKPFLEMHRIVSSLRKRDLTHALEWAFQNQEGLARIGSSLAFNLHKLRFLTLLCEEGQLVEDIIKYSHKLQDFAPQHTLEIQQVMGAVLFQHRGLADSPYTHLLEDARWDEVCERFSRDACALLGFSAESPLSTALGAGVSSLSPLLSIRAVMKQRQVVSSWTGKDELPIEIPFGKEASFHTIFACPILRQRTTEANPPMRLVCGHVISKDALSRLTHSIKLKCPYCPVEQSPKDSVQMHL